MPAEENKRVVKRLFSEGMNNRNFTIVDEIFHQRSVHHGFTYPVQGPEGFKELMNQFLNGFPDLALTVERTVAEDDMVATMGTWTGTQRGEFMGIPATGKKVQVGYMDMWRLENGKCIENWVQMDIAGLMHQLGVTAPAAEAV
jgi:steroid delta-isomerase-like uncharacterized protein